MNLVTKKKIKMNGFLCGVGVRLVFFRVVVEKWSFQITTVSNKLKVQDSMLIVSQLNPITKKKSGQTVNLWGWSSLGVFVE